MNTATDAVLVGDVGGTHARFGLWRRGALVEQAGWPTAALPSLTACVARLRGTWRFGQVAVAVAGPVMGRRAALTNAGWAADLDEIDEDGLLLNDLEAAAWGCGAGAPDGLRGLIGGDPSDHGDAAVVGVGTGLGQALWLGEGRAIPGEGGHAHFAPRDAAERRLAAFVEAELGRTVEVEDVLSGAGLGRIAAWIEAEGAGEAPPAADPTARGRWVVAEQGRHPVAARAAGAFWSLLAGELRNVALRTLPPRGVFVVGGLCPRLLPSADLSAIQRAFEGEGPLAWRLRGLSVQLVDDDALALRGAAAAAQARR